MTGAGHALSQLCSARVIPVIRTTDTAEARRRLQWLVDAGVEVIELTTTVPSWNTLLREFSSAPSMIGVGTVTSREQAWDAIVQGAHFVVSPTTAAGVAEVAASSDCLFLEGGYSPSELLTAIDRCGAAKLYPASADGRVIMQAILALRPTAHLFPSGGISLADTEEWDAAGATGVFIGSSLPLNDETQHKLSELRKRPASSSLTGQTCK